MSCVYTMKTLNESAHNDWMVFNHKFSFTI